MHDVYKGKDSSFEAIWSSISFTVFSPSTENENKNETRQEKILDH